MTALRTRMLDELQLRNLSKCTVRAYLTAVEQFARYFHVSPEKLGCEQVREYLLHLIRDNKAQCSTVVVNRSALRFLYVSTLKQRWFDDEIPHPKKRLILPHILSAEEITRMLDATSQGRGASRHGIHHPFRLQTRRTDHRSTAADLFDPRSDG